MRDGWQNEELAPYLAVLDHVGEDEADKVNPEEIEKEDDGFEDPDEGGCDGNCDTCPQMANALDKDDDIDPDEDDCDDFDDEPVEDDEFDEDDGYFDDEDDEDF